jgi:O-antigen ligase
MAFVSIINFYIFIKKENGATKYLYLFIFLTSIFLLLFINTRMAIMDTAIGCIIVVFYQLKNKENVVKLLINTFITVLFIGLLSIVFLKKDSYLKEKFSSIAFAHMDKVGRLDEIDHPEVAVYSSLVTRISIWKSALELSYKELPFGTGSSDGRNELVKYYKKTNQIFLAKYKFATHNQYIDFLLKFGFIGLVVTIGYIFSFLYFGLKTQEPILVASFFLFFTSNLTDDFLIRFDGIVFSGFWLTIFACLYMQKMNINNFKNT